MDKDNKMDHSRSVFRGSFVKQRGVEHGLLRVGGLLAAVLAEGGPALVVALQLEVAGRGVVGAVVAGGGGDLALGPGAAVPAAAALVTTSSQHGDKEWKKKSLHTQLDKINRLHTACILPVSRRQCNTEFAVLPNRLVSRYGGWWWRG